MIGRCGLLDCYYDFPHEHKESTSPGICGKEKLEVKKVPLGDLPPAGIIHGAAAAAYGNEKYGFYDYRTTKISYMSNLNAMLRHLVSIVDGENEAPDSLVHHLGHVIATSAKVLDALERGNIVDDRPSKGNAAALLRRMERPK